MKNVEYGDELDPQFKFFVTLTDEERSLLFTAVEMAWYQQPVRDSAGKEMKGKWTKLLEDLDKVAE